MQLQQMELCADVTYLNGRQCRTSLDEAIRPLCPSSRSIERFKVFAATSGSMKGLLPHQSNLEAPVWQRLLVVLPYQLLMIRRNHHERLLKPEMPASGSSYTALIASRVKTVADSELAQLSKRPAICVELMLEQHSRGAEFSCGRNSSGSGSSNSLQGLISSPSEKPVCSAIRITYSSNLTLTFPLFTAIRIREDPQGG